MQGRGKTPNHDPKPPLLRQKKKKKRMEPRIKLFKIIDHLIMSSSEPYCQEQAKYFLAFLALRSTL